MATLSTKERKELPTEIFGLPSDRKYPLTDEAHVRKAIQFFKFCPPGKRNELSKNINARAKELGMTLRLTKDSTYYKYADKSIIKESTYEEYELQRLIEVGEGEINECINLIQGELQVAIGQTLKKLLINASVNHFVSIEKEIQDKILDNETFKRTFERVGYEHCINPIQHVNTAMSKAYKILFSFLEYNYPGLDLSTHRMINGVFEDIFFYLKTSICNHAPACQVKDKLKLIEDLINHYDCNLFFVVRKLQELIIQTMIEKCSMMKTPLNDEVKDLITNLDDINNTLITFTSTLTPKCTYGLDGNIPTIQNRGLIFDTLRSSNMNFTHSTDYLKVIKNELKSQIDIILLTNDIKLSYANDYDNIRFISFDVVDVNHRVILDILTFLEGSIKKENIKLYNKKYSLCLDSKDLLTFSELKKFDRMYVGKDYKGGNVYVGILGVWMGILTVLSIIIL